MANVGLILGIVLPISLTILSLLVYVLVEYCIRKGKNESRQYQEAIHQGRVPNNPAIFAAPMANDNIYKIPSPAYGKPLSWTSSSSPSPSNPSYNSYASRPIQPLYNPAAPPAYPVVNSEYSMPVRA